MAATTHQEPPRAFDRERLRERRSRRVALAVVLSVLGHLCFVGLLMFLSQVHVGEPARQRGPPRPVTLRPLSAQQWAQNRRARPSGKDSPNPATSQPAPAPKPPEKKAEPTPNGQVVDVAPGNGQEDPNAKYLAESSNRVQKESRAKEQTAFYRNAMPKRTTSAPQQGAGQDAVPRAQTSGNNGIGNDDRPLQKAGKKQELFEVPDLKPRQEVAMRMDKGEGPGSKVTNRPERAQVKGNSNRLEIQPGETGEGAQETSQGKVGAPGVTNLVPSMSIVDRISGGAANDHLSNVDEGTGTFLNTKEWKYSGFFNRVKQSVGLHWDPATELRQRDPTGNIYGGRDRFTLVNVTLTERGAVKEIFVEKSSGLDFLDAEAIRSFERAQPFPNPPPGLMGSDSAIRFSFGFFLEMGNGARMHLFGRGG